MRTITSINGIAVCAVLALTSGCAMGSPSATGALPTALPPSPSIPAAEIPSDPTNLPTPSLEPYLTATPEASKSPDATPTATPSPPEGTLEPEEEDFPNRVPKVTIRTEMVTYALRPWTWCYIPGCLDGFPPDDPPSVAEAGQVEVGFPIGDWTFVAEFREVGPRCPRTQQVVLPRTSENTWLIEPAGYAGTYDVDVFGYNDGGNDAPSGDVVVTFRWNTPGDGLLPEPRAQGGVYSETSSGIVSYGADFRLIDLAARPESLRVEMTVTSSNGNSFSFEFKPHLSCYEDVYFNAPNNVAERATELGPPPSTYDIVMVLDGQRYESRALWPHDETAGFYSGTEFRFTPPLPSLQPRP